MRQSGTGRVLQGRIGDLGRHPLDQDAPAPGTAEIATVGLGSEAARAAGYEVEVGQARFLGNGKALGEDEPDGLVQLCADAATGRILGATVMGVHAVEIIHEVGVAISDGLTVGELGDIIHAHPTVSELVMEAAEQAEGLAPYLS